ncbi:MAG: hypothetical protein II072_02775 [Clostridia bacterium]|nr:hypothetical protein [Clostridia bacterium]
MKNEDLFNAFSDIDESLLEKSEKPSAFPARYAAVAAVCASAVLLLVFGIFKLINNRSAVPGEQIAAATPASTAAPRITRAPEIETEHEYIHGWSFDMAMDISPYIFEGVCLSAPDSAGDTDMYSPMPSYVFRVERVFRGDLEPGDEIIVRSAEDFGFAVGKTHLILAEAYASVFEQIELYFAPLAACREDRNGVILGDDLVGLEQLDHDSVIEYLTGMLPSHPYTGTGTVTGAYCTSTTLPAIVDYSDLIISVRPERVLINEFHARTTYLCTVTDTFKGSCEETIRVTAFKNSMQLGDSYLLLLIQPDPAYAFYELSSVKSVLPLSSDEAQAVIGLIE